MVQGVCESVRFLQVNIRQAGTFSVRGNGTETNKRGATLVVVCSGSSYLRRCPEAQADLAVETRPFLQSGALATHNDHRVLFAERAFGLLEYTFRVHYWRHHALKWG